MTRFLLSAVAAGVLAVSAARGETMPQLDFGNPMLVSQVVWGAIIFAGFYFAVARIGLPGVGAILEQRARTIDGDLAQAREAKDRADRAVAELNEARRRSYAESQATLAAAVAKAKTVAAEQASEVNARLDRQIEESETRIGAAREAALGALRGIATDTAEAVVQRLTGREADRDQVRVAITDELAARGLAHAA